MSVSALPRGGVCAACAKRAALHPVKTVRITRSNHFSKHKGLPSRVVAPWRRDSRPGRERAAPRPHSAHMEGYLGADLRRRAASAMPVTPISIKAQLWGSGIGGVPPLTVQNSCKPMRV